MVKPGGEKEGGAGARNKSWIVSKQEKDEKAKEMGGKKNGNKIEKQENL